MRENRLQKRVADYLKKLPGVWFYVVNDRTTSGIPDIIGCWNGKFFGIELKVKGNKPSALQKYTTAKIKMAGGSAIIAYDLDTVKQFFSG